MRLGTWSTYLLVMPSLEPQRLYHMRVSLQWNPVTQGARRRRAEKDLLNLI